MSSYGACVFDRSRSAIVDIDMGRNSNSELNHWDEFDRVQDTITQTLVRADLPRAS